MNKRIVLLLAALLLAVPFAVAAQESTPEPAVPQEDLLDCPDFESSPAEVRISYYMGEGAAFMNAGQFASAIDSYTCITQQIDDRYLDAYLNRAVAHTARRSYELAIEDYTTALDIDSAYIPAYNNRGIVYAAQLEYDLALADFNEALSLDSNYVVGYNNRGVILAAQGDLDGAIADFEQVIAITGVDGVVADLRDPDRPEDAPFPGFSRDGAQAYALLGIVYSQIALENYNDYLLLTRDDADRRIESAAGALESRFTFELRFDDGTWLLTADISG